MFSKWIILGNKTRLLIYIYLRWICSNPVVTTDPVIYVDLENKIILYFAVG